ncbi:MAG: hypothetical protein H6920_09695 [Sphingomonadaceae bacterium]|jgi:hypothetical protein|nr:hypothetical protein [Sphingomonadaceae bacterium]MCP5383253.1 hypothetical protein [Altererythrobacter sp.]MCP5391879.1 hypothetical protein [Sphingomonadaceae bacterium]MCP5393430.1 hypothetical protein [Sphingomonadaceae bacterium]
MPVHESVALIFVTIAFFAGVWGVTDTVLKHRRKMAEIKFGRSDREVQLSADKAELKETVAMLQDRLTVLETIATDPARRTAEEIERLR